MGTQNHWYHGRSPGGHHFPECGSAMQKCIRRSQVDDAVYWAAQLHKSGYGGYAWKRLRIIVSEDIGIANPTLPATIWALYQSWDEQNKKKGDNPAQAQLFLVHAVLLAASSPKSRMVDNLRIANFDGPEEDISRDMPDVAIDKHTGRGSRAGRDLYHFIEEGSKLEQPGPLTQDDEDFCRKRAEALLVKLWHSGSKDKPNGNWGTISATSRHPQIPSKPPGLKILPASQDNDPVDDSNGLF